jgi:hypothetical protein
MVYSFPLLMLEGSNPFTSLIIFAREESKVDKLPALNVFRRGLGGGSIS